MSYRSVVTVLFLLLAVTAFAQNQPPAAEPQTVYTNGKDVEITLRGQDPEGTDLRFEIVDGPRHGDVSDPEPIIPEPEIDPRTGEPFQPPVTSARVVYRPGGEPAEDSFTFSVTDEKGASGIAVVTIDPPDVEPPPPPVDTVIAHDTTGDVFKDSQNVLTLTGAEPEGVSLTFSLIEKPARGEVGELVQGSEEPRRSATLPYAPERGFTGDDVFTFKACGVIDQREVCDDAVYRIRVIERPQEPKHLVADLHLTAKIDRPLDFSLASNISRDPVDGERFTLRALVAGGVADSDRDGRGDNRNELPGPEPLFMAAGVDQDNGPGAKGTARMQMEFDVRELKGLGNRIVRAGVLLHTHRRTEQGLTTFFHWQAKEGDGELAESDFEADAERIPGAVMPVPQEMRVGEEGTFTFGVLGPLKAALQEGHGVFAVQGRVNEKAKGPDTGLEVRTSAEENLGAEVEPQLLIELAGNPDPLTYTVLTVPEFGTLKDANGTEIREVPYRLPNDVLVYIPDAKYIGEVTFGFSGTDGISVDVATAIINILRARCGEDAHACDNGR